MYGQSLVSSSSAGGDGVPELAGTLLTEPPCIIAALSAIFTHKLEDPNLISALTSKKEGFGIGWLLLHFIKEMHVRTSVSCLDLSEFSLDAGKLAFLLSSLPKGPAFLLETLRGGPSVCKSPCVSVLRRFLRGGLGTGAASLKNLNLSKCDLSDSCGAALLHSLPLPSCLECLDLSDNRLRSLSMEALVWAFEEGALSKLLSLDVSNNPLGPGGVAILARGLGGSGQREGLPLRTLRLSQTGAEDEGVGGSE
uniref:NACHT LRR and PYD domain-containing protein n=1 Tax=Chromera velia CCMP2878 TaxID=1169474 RepID=A0A0G4F8C1_9ALVE|eukprot:Cvel_15691.t1-p1 / transcript=Cvel_15691.t1 / gene=Cvel_15691 / organism=Chromera_velia_CCMP2878 / gene_product=hypothetical protein / transcript_product=hypothetical protein / location=Cvel_scaffold1171:31457-35132(+) / protein_length=251 / sequence_SO=supercontig / SO=protein_coding / is_pseudo=false